MSELLVSDDGPSAIEYNNDDINYTSDDDLTGERVADSEENNTPDNKDLGTSKNSRYDTRMKLDDEWRVQHNLSKASYRKACEDICTNIRHNLVNLKSGHQSTMRRDERKLAYLTIVNTVLRGPAHIHLEDVVTILSINRDTIEKIKSMDIRNNWSPDKYHYRDNYSLKDSRSSAPVLSPGKSALLLNLRHQFQYFARLGDRTGDGTHITMSQSDRWMKQARIIDGRTVTTVDTDIIFKKMTAGHIWMNFNEWILFVRELAKIKNFYTDDLYEALILCGKPQFLDANFDRSSITTRLTDPNHYGGTHRFRFDSNGRGLGLPGRRDYRDLPALWPTPPSDDSGLLGYLPSLLGAGREGATSPLSLNTSSLKRRSRSVHQILRD